MTNLKIAIITAGSFIVLLGLSIGIGLGLISGISSIHQYEVNKTVMKQDAELKSDALKVSQSVALLGQELKAIPDSLTQSVYRKYYLGK